MSEPADLLVTGGSVLTVDDVDTVVADRAVAAGDGAILAVGPAFEPGGRIGAAGVLDATGCLVRPVRLRGGITTAIDLYWYPEAASEVAAGRLPAFEGPSSMDLIDFDGRDFDRRMAWASNPPGARRTGRRPWSAVAYALGAADVRHTPVDGRVLLHDRVLTTLDEFAVLVRMNRFRQARHAACEETR